MGKAVAVLFLHLAELGMASMIDDARAEEGQVTSDENVTHAIERKMLDSRFMAMTACEFVSEVKNESVLKFKFNLIVLS